MRLGMSELELRENTRKWTMVNRDRKGLADLALHLRKKYGLTFERYSAMYKAQDNLCAICGTELQEFQPTKRRERTNKIAHVDHCHATNRVRGLLCFRCNTGIGQFLDSPSRLRAAIAYLVKHGISEDA